MSDHCMLKLNSTLPPSRMDQWGSISWFATGKEMLNWRAQGDALQLVIVRNIEALALCFGLQSATNYGLHNLILETDSRKLFFCAQ